MPDTDEPMLEVVVTPDDIAEAQDALKVLIAYLEQHNVTLLDEEQAKIVSIVADAYAAERTLAEAEADDS